MKSGRVEEEEAEEKAEEEEEEEREGDGGHTEWQKASSGWGRGRRAV